MNTHHILQLLVSRGRERISDTALWLEGGKSWTLHAAAAALHYFITKMFPKCKLCEKFTYGKLSDCTRSACSCCLVPQSRRARGSRDSFVPNVLVDIPICLQLNLPLPCRQYFTDAVAFVDRSLCDNFRFHPFSVTPSRARARIEKN